MAGVKKLTIPVSIRMYTHLRILSSLCDLISFAKQDGVILHTTTVYTHLSVIPTIVTLFILIIYPQYPQNKLNFINLLLIRVNEFDELYL